MMYPVLRIASFLQKVIAVINAVFGVCVYLYVVLDLQVSASVLQAQGAGFLAGINIPIVIVATFLLMNWLTGCVFVYAIGSFIDLMLSVEKSLWALRLNVTQTL